MKLVSLNRSRIGGMVARVLLACALMAALDASAAFAQAPLRLLATSVRSGQGSSGGSAFVAEAIRRTTRVVLTVPPNLSPFTP